MTKLNYLNMVKGKNNLLSVVLIFFGLMSCEVKSDYTKAVENALESGKRNDSIFFSFYFGMPSKDFFGTCWEMNKKGMIKQGPGNKSVEYYFEDKFNEPVFMRFYPRFEEGKIVEMPVDFLYEAWAPWNRHLSADSLMPKVINLLSDWHDAEFQLQESDNGRKVYFNIDGNRQILIFKQDSSRVGVKYTDIFLDNPLTQ